MLPSASVDSTVRPCATARIASQISLRSASLAM